MKLTVVHNVERVPNSPFAPDLARAYMGVNAMLSDETHVMVIVEFYVPEPVADAFEQGLEETSTVELEYPADQMREVLALDGSVVVQLILPEIITINV